MNLAFCLFNYFPYGGLERDFMAVALESIKRGHSVTVFTMKWEGDAPEDMTVNIIPACGISNHRQISSFFKNAASLVRDPCFDSVIGFNRVPGLDIYFASDTCYVERIKSQRNALSFLTPRYRLFSKYEKSLFSTDSDTEIIYLSKLQKLAYQKVYQTQDHRFHHVPPGVNRSRFSPSTLSPVRDRVRSEFSLEPSDNCLLMIGSHFHTKGVSRSILALASLPPKIMNKTFLLIIGRGEKQKYLKLAQQLGIQSRVFFLGSRDDVPCFLAAADLVLQPSISESAGNVIVEALVAGVPVIATSTCGYAEHINQSQAGCVISGSPYIQEEMNSTLTKILSGGHNKEMRKRALAYAEQTDLYNRSKIVVDLIEEITNKRKKNSSIHNAM